MEHCPDAYDCRKWQDGRSLSHWVPCVYKGVLGHVGLLHGRIHEVCPKRRNDLFLDADVHDWSEPLFV